ncbi:hypothetical protein HRbin09_00577 [bacterium HR09]|nr:hypothetical protein HRbin09_00577 [bacterium HR09]
MRVHVNGLVLGVRFVFGGANHHTQGAAGAVLRCHLDGVLPAFELRCFVIGGLEGCRCILEVLGWVDLGPDGRVGAHQRAFVALNTQRSIPHRDFQSNVALFPLGGAGRPCAVHRKGAHRQIVTLALHHYCGNSLDKIGSLFRNHRRTGAGGGDPVRDLDLEEVGQGGVHGSKVLAHHLLAFFAVGLLDGFLNLGDGFFPGEHAGNGKKAGLHDGVDAHPHAGFLGHLVSVNDIKLELFLENLLLHFPR